MQKKTDANQENTCRNRKKKKPLHEPVTTTKVLPACRGRSEQNSAVERRTGGLKAASEEFLVFAPQSSFFFILFRLAFVFLNLYLFYPRVWPLSATVHLFTDKLCTHS